MCDIYIYIILGLAVGYVGGFAGIGGGPFLVSFLVLFCSMTQLSAQGNVLTMMLGPMSLMGVISMYSFVKQQWSSIIVGVIAYCFFSYFGALAAFHIGENDIRTYFALLLLIIAGIQLFPFIVKKKGAVMGGTKSSAPLLWIFILGAITGIIGGLFGIGAGVLMIPILIGPFKMNKDFARALSLAILVPPVSYGAYIKYNLENTINWNLVLVLFISYFIANYFGAKAGTRVSDSKFKLMYAVVLVGIAIAYFV